MAALSDPELEAFCQARGVNGTAMGGGGRSYDHSLAYGAMRIVGGAGSRTKKHLLEQKIGLNASAVTTRLGELGGAGDNVFGGAR